MKILYLLFVVMFTCKINYMHGQTSLKKEMERINVSINMPSFLKASQNEDLIYVTEVTKEDPIPTTAQNYRLEPSCGATYFKAMFGMVNSIIRFEDEDCLVFVFVSLGKGGSGVVLDSIDLRDITFDGAKIEFQYGDRPNFGGASYEECRHLVSMVKIHPKEQAQKLFNANAMISYPKDLKGNVYERKYKKCQHVQIGKNKHQIYLNFLFTKRSYKHFEKYLNALEKVFWYND